MDLPIPESNGERKGKMDRKVMKKVFFSNKMTVLCTGLLLAVMAASLLAPLSPYDPDAVNVAEKLQGMSSKHIWGGIPLPGPCMAGEYLCWWDSQLCVWRFLSAHSSGQ